MAIYIHRALAECIECIARGIRESQVPEDRKLAGDYLAALAPLLAAAVLGKDILRELPAVERLFGNTWLIDETPFSEAFSRWRQFHAEYEQVVLSGMTVNERLSALGTDTAYERACACRDYPEIERILKAACVDDASIRKILDRI